MGDLIKYHPLPKFVTEKFSREILFVEKKFGLKTESLKLYLALHIFKYSLSEIFDNRKPYIPQNVNKDVINKELEFLATNILNNNTVYEELNTKTINHPKKSYLKKENGRIWELLKSSKQVISEVHFKEVNPKTGFDIQDKLHYIKNKRKDTLYHFGLFRENAHVPFVYCSISELNRNYLINLPHFNGVNKDDMLVKTRAFGFSNCPKNSMSTLYSSCMHFFKQNSNYEICVTAVNPNLLFSAQSFLGCSYFPIAKVSIDYYYINGIYSPRRKVEKRKGDKTAIITKAKTNPYPIFWLARGITKKMILHVENVSSSIGVVEISREEYKNK